MAASSNGLGYTRVRPRDPEPRVGGGVVDRSGSSGGRDGGSNGSGNSGGGGSGATSGGYTSGGGGGASMAAPAAPQFPGRPAATTDNSAQHFRGGS